MALAFNGGTNVITGLATGGLPDGCVDQDTLASSVNTITYADIYRLTSDFDGNQDPITSNWERDDHAAFGNIGGVAAPSSGVFSFPVTGIWRVDFNIYFASLNHENAWPTYSIYATTDNSSYSVVATNSNTIYNGSDSWNYGQSSMKVLIDVDNVSNVKVRVGAVNDGNSSSIRTRGDSTQNVTYLTFTRLGAT